jgi:ion channel-forming bestrophin family protein
MINYNPKEWFTFIFRFHKADTFRKLGPMMIAIGMYSFVVTYIFLEVLHLDKDYPLKNLSMMHSTLGFVISLLLVFRTNTAYDRWWEGRKLFGALTNSSRNLAMKLNTVLTEKKDKLYFKIMISNFTYALSHHLKNSLSTKDFMTTSDFEFADLENVTHRPNFFANKIWFYLYSVSPKTNNEMEKTIHNDLTIFTEVSGACERIRNTPIPFSYSVFLKKFIFFYIMTLPMAYTFSMAYFSIPVVIFIFYVLASLELIAEEIEDPFGTDTNDLNTHNICSNIKKNIEEILK